VTADFGTWLRAAFDHPAAEPEWYWSDDFDDQWQTLDLSDDDVVAYLTILFRDPRPLEVFSSDQVAQGIWFLVGEASPAQPCHTLLRPTVPLEARVACVTAMADFFRLFVAPRAPGSAETDSDAFHTACYMWWDIFPAWGGAEVGEPELHLACLQAMVETLNLHSELCQLSALHGLNHWHMHYPGQVEEAIDSFLQQRRTISRAVREYAATARKGCAL
jgi:hypothetical protein